MPIFRWDYRRIECQIVDPLVARDARLDNLIPASLRKVKMVEFLTLPGVDRIDARPYTMTAESRCKKAKLMRPNVGRDC